MEFPQFIGPTLVTRDAAEIKKFHAEHRDIILKPLDGMGGMGIFRVREDGLNLGSIIETLNRDGAQSVMVQNSSRRLPRATSASSSSVANLCRSAWRAFLRAARFGAIWRQAARGPSRCLRGIWRSLSRWGPFFFERGLLLAGVDVIGDSVTEINVTSPTCFQEIFDQTGCDVASPLHRRRAGGGRSAEIHKSSVSCIWPKISAMIEGFAAQRACF